MEDYNFWADLLTTYRSNPDWLKGAWLLVAAAIPICITAIIGYALANIFGWPRRRRRRGRRGRRGTLETSYRSIATLSGPLGESGLYRVMTDADGVPHLEQVGTAPMLDWDDPEKG